MIAIFAPEKIKVLVFDVDDTLTRDTINLKAGVWSELFAEKLEELEEARELYEYTGNGDRYNIIAHVIDEPQVYCKENFKVIEYAQKFEEMTMLSIRQNGMHLDDVDALRLLKQQYNGKMYVLSATPQDAVKGNIEYFMSIYPELEGIFVDIVGTPMDNGKGGELRKIANMCRVYTDEVIMIGDGGSDYTGALDAGTQFIGIVPEGKQDQWETDTFPKVSSIAGVINLLYGDN